MARSVAVLILNLNGKPHLDECLRSVLAQIEKQDRVYLVDNGSVDGSVQYVRAAYPDVKAIRFDRNLGFAEAYNRAVANVGEELVVFLNNDVQVDRGWMHGLKAALESSTEEVAACGSKILFYRDRGLVNHAGGKLLPIGGGIDIDFMMPDKGDDLARTVGCVSGASMIMPRSVFSRLGGFDRDFFAYFEDVDLCWRAWLAGYKVLYVPSSRIFHKLSATMGPLLKPDRIFLGERNRVQSMIKNLEWQNLLIGLLVSAVYNTIRAVRFLSLSKASAVLAILRADWWTLSHLSQIILKRRYVQRSRRVRDAFLVRNGLMVSFGEGLREFMRLAEIWAT